MGKDHSCSAHAVDGTTLVLSSSDGTTSLLMGLMDGKRSLLLGPVDGTTSLLLSSKDGTTQLKGWKKNITFDGWDKITHAQLRRCNNITSLLLPKHIMYARIAF
jgi:hypothetical protein